MYMTFNIKKEIEAIGSGISLVKRLEIIYLWDTTGFWVLGIEDLNMESLI